MKGLETLHQVELRISRKEGSVRIRGEKSAVLTAKTAVEGVLHGDIQQSSQVFAVQPLIFQFIIGKGDLPPHKLTSCLTFSFSNHPCVLSQHTHSTQVVVL